MDLPPAGPSLRSVAVPGPSHNIAPANDDCVHRKYYENGYPADVKLRPGHAGERAGCSSAGLVLPCRRRQPTGAVRGIPADIVLPAWSGPSPSSHRRLELVDYVPSTYARPMYRRQRQAVILWRPVGIASCSASQWWCSAVTGGRIFCLLPDRRSSCRSTTCSWLLVIISSWGASSRATKERRNRSRLRSSRAPDSPSALCVYRVEPTGSLPSLLVLLVMAGNLARPTG